MKKAIVASMLALLVLTGCGKKETVECINTQKSYGVELDSKITVELNNNKFVNLVMTIDAILPESYLAQKQVFISSFEKQYENFKDQYGVQPVVTETETGAQIKMEMSAEQASEFYGSKNNKATRKEVIEEFEGQGFTCK